MCVQILERVWEAKAKWQSNANTLTLDPFNYEVDLNSHLSAPNGVHHFDRDVPLTKIEYDIMNSEDEPLSGLNGRLRPRKSTAPNPQATKAVRKSESKPALDRPKRTSTPSKAASKSDDLNKPDLSPVPAAPQLLCPFCDRKFASKQTVTKHARRIHLSNTKQDSIDCLFCSSAEADPNDIIRHMVDDHPNQYFACLDCHTRFLSTSDLAKHKISACEKQKEKPYRSKLRQKVPADSKKSQKALKIDDKELSNDDKVYPDGHCFNGVVISCELKPSHVSDEADIEDNITTNLILPPKNLGTNAVIEKNAVIVLDDIQWNKRMPANFSFHNTDADQILSRLGVVHRWPRTGESTKKQWYKIAEEPVQKFEKCFDTGFYSKVASNVHENLSRFLDGSFNFNPDPDSIIKTRKSKNSVVINAAEGFPILLAFEQYSRNVFDGYIPRTLAPKHKWKWESDKILLNPDDIKRDSHVNNCIITLVSSLDIWTQLCMRRKFEDKFSIPPLEKKTEKQNTISKELKQILESRELPSSSRQLVKYTSKPKPPTENVDFATSLGLKPSAPALDMEPAVLSGEWVRPRCYVCCACGAQTRDSRGLSSHISAQHPNAQVQHYEIVGELLLNSDILKHLYVPPSQMSNRTRPLRGFRDCTKCRKSISLEDLHQHMLDCAGDTPAVRRKCRYRPFGVRRRRPRLPDNTIRKKIRKDLRSRQTRQKAHMRQRPKIRSEVGDAETIRKMLADLPAKRHRVMVNPLNPILRPRRKLDKQRNKIIIKRRSSDIGKNRNQRNLRKLTDSNPSGSNAGDDENDNKSDEDNRPLKPKIKRVLTRQSESLKRKVALNRAKRRAKIKEQRLNENILEPEEAPEDMGEGESRNIRGDQLPMAPSQDTIDVGEGPDGAREQSNRGQSNRGNNRGHSRGNRNDQPIGSDGNNPNGDPNNPLGPMNNNPLKHSIARLTAETDAHNRALQYHQLYLMQPPESSEADEAQHVPSGQQRVFENEAVVTKLDKPPLHFTPPPPMDSFAYRNKLPKPKKGLNDCIAMLKNKLVDPIPPEKMTHAVQCGNDDRINCESMMVSQRPPPYEYPMDLQSRPAEIYSRHQFIPEGYMEFPREANMIAQNYAELPFHYIPAQRMPPYDLPPPADIAPKYVKPTRQKQNEAQGKREPVRRRSARTDKNAMNKQDVNARMAAMSYSMNMPAPSKVNSVQGRRLSSQNVTANANTATARRRASMSYNRTNAARQKQLHEYEAIMAQQRIMEFRQHQQQHMPPEAHMMELARAETYTQTQINKQNQLIAEQMIENYINQKQLAICVDNNYANKMLTAAAYAESMYANSKHATMTATEAYELSKLMAASPGNRYNNNKQLVISPVNRYDNTQRLHVSPGNQYDSNQHMNVSPRSGQATMVNPGSGYDNTTLVVSPGSQHDNSMNQLAVNTGRYDNNKSMTISPGNQYGHGKNMTVSPRSMYELSKRAIISPGSRHDSNINAASTAENYHGQPMQASVSPGNSYDANKNLEISSVHNYDNNSHTTISPGNNNNKNASLSPGSHHDNNLYLNVSPGTKYGNSKQGSVSPGNNYISKKQAAVAAESNHNNNKHTGLVSETHFISKKQAATSEISQSKKQVAPNPENSTSGNHDLNSTGSNVLTKSTSTYTESGFISKKAQAVAVENQSANKGPILPSADTDHTIKTRTPPRIDNNTMSENQALINPDIDYSNTQVVNFNENIHSSNISSSSERSVSVETQRPMSAEIRYGNQSSASNTENHYRNENQAVTFGDNPNNHVVSSDHLHDKNVPSECDNRTNTNVSVEYYASHDFRRRSVPKVYNTVDESYPKNIEAPLDLSKPAKEDKQPVLSYGMLDLSHRDPNNDHNLAVDLSVKIPSETKTSPSTIVATEAKNSNNETVEAADLSLGRDNDTPTDLTTKSYTKANNLKGEVESDANSDNRENDLLEEETPPEETKLPLSTIENNSDIPSDIPGRLSDIPLHVTSDKTLHKQIDSVGTFEEKEGLSADLSGNKMTLETAMRSQEVPEPNLVKEKAISDSANDQCDLHTPLSESSYVTYESSAQKSQYELPPSTYSPSITDEVQRSQNSCNSQLINENKTSENIEVGKHDTSVSKIIANKEDTETPTSTSKHDSTTPVYTLANACISTTKADPSHIGRSSQSVSSDELAAPVYTLTETTVSETPTIRTPMITQKTTTVSLPSISAEEPVQKTGSVNYDGFDPETAKKIALLPKELVEILGTMPIDHRNQLLNVLPQYVSTSAPSNQNEVSRTETHDIDIKPSLGYSPASTQMKQSTTPVMSSIERFEDTKSFHSYQPGIASQPVVHVGKTEPSEQMHMFQSGSDTVIDLTDDDVPLNTAEEKTAENSNNDAVKPCEPLIIAPLNNKSGKQINEQTASLRAVRIKAPSERNKSLSIDITPPNKSTSSNVEAIGSKSSSVDSDKTQAIQEVEIKSTQPNSVDTLSHVISSSSSDPSGNESIKSTESQRSPIVSTKVVKSNITVNAIYEKPLRKMSSSVYNNEEHPKDVENKIAEATDQSNALLLMPDKDSDKPGAIVPEIKLNETPLDISTAPSELEEDSDDDLCLAAIVKQKQQDQPKTVVNKSEDVKNIDTKKKKKDRKSKKAAKKAKNVIHENIKSDTLIHVDKESHCNTISNSGDEEPDVDSEIINIQNLIHQTEVEINKHSKKKVKRGRQTADHKVVESNKGNKIINFIEEDINKENDRTSKVINNKVNSEENTSDYANLGTACMKDLMPGGKVATIEQDVGKVKISKKIIKELSADPVIKLSKCDDKLSAHSAKTVNEIKAKGEIKITDEETKETARVLHSDQNISAEETAVSNIISVTPNHLNDKEPISEKLLKPESKNDIQSNIVKKIKKTVRTKLSEKDIYEIDYEFDSTENVSCTPEAHDNILTPLRRSRRGKSLYLDSTSMEKESVVAEDVNTEQKAPLTKKQLIFSKLLLDEERPRPSAHSTPEKQDVITSEKSDLIDSKIIVSPERSELKLVDELYPEKPKGKKRRSGSQCSKKTKKKKSVDESCTTNESSSNIELAMEQSTSSNHNSSIEIGTSKLTNHGVFTSDVANDADALCDQTHELSNMKTNIDVHILSTEKRKNNNQISFDLNQSSKPKKCRLNKIDKKAFVSNEDKNDDPKTDVSMSSTTCETKTACYNLPLPMRRARSKSVVVKSSTYDPYDIDLEDMIEQGEMFERKDKNADNGTKNRTNKSSIKNVNKHTKDVGKDNSNKEIDRNIKDDKAKESAISDSDDSSKSDVPLQKYVEEKEKKIQEVEHNNVSTENETKNCVKKDLDEKIPSPDIQIAQASQAQAEEELRSEQFMESFGFFSERKPRKSNLLATKKISETFHITNESDDMYFGFKERSVKRNLNTEINKTTDSELTKNQILASTSKKSAPKRGRKTKKCISKITHSYCAVCKKEFRRTDNYLRHQMSLLHISRISDMEMKFKTQPVLEEPNYLIAYKQYLGRLKKLTDILAKKKKKYPKAAAKIVLPTRDEVLADVNKAVRDQQVCARGLSRDEALFLDCCELLKESHKLGPCSINTFGMSGLDILEKAINNLETIENLSEDDTCDSITAQNILESEEVRNLENDLISGLKEAANATRQANMEYQHSLGEFRAPEVIEMVEHEHAQQAAELIEQVPCVNEIVNDTEKIITQDIPDECCEQFSSPNVADCHYDQIEEFDVPPKPRQVKPKKHYEVKEKMYPDILIEDIDMFEDKFDKIKRKCRSQAAAAKQTQPVVDLQIIRHKGRKKSEKKKGKRSSKKARHQNSQVPTKGALKGFDSIKVSIPTSDINMSAIVPVSESSPKKRKKSSSKKKRDKRDSESSYKYESEHRAKDNSAKKVDVYEFMDNEDAELFEFRPSTLMERFKSISNNNRDVPSTSKFIPDAEDNSSVGSASDGDDFVYMSDDYVGSDDETENSLLSCELGNVKVGVDNKKSSPHKRKDTVEKNAVMGKIFKHNAVRAEKKVVISKEPEKPKANLDQLFDSLLEEEPNSSMLNSEAASPKDDDSIPATKYRHKSNIAERSYNQLVDDNIFAYPNKSRSSSPCKVDSHQTSPLLKRRSSSPSKNYASTHKKHESPHFKKYESHEIDYGPSTSKKYDCVPSVDYGPSTSKKYFNAIPKDCKKSSPKIYNSVPLQKEEESLRNYDTKSKKRKDSSSSRIEEELFNSYDDDLTSVTNKPDEGISTSYDYSAEVYDLFQEDETGVARQRARRKCTVGKQNVLAETWSSESEPDGGPARPNSAESHISGVTRKRKGRKKDGQQAGGRRGNNRQVAPKKMEVENRSNRISSAGSIEFDDPGEGTSGMSSGGGGSGGGGGGSGGGSGGGGSGGSGSGDGAAAAAAAAAAAMPAPLAKGRPRPASYWSSEGDDEQEHLQQHGWIVGDSHKKLVTMLAHAKGRKRNNDDKRHLVE